MYHSVTFNSWEEKIVKGLLVYCNCLIRGVLMKKFSSRGVDAMLSSIFVKDLSKQFSSMTWYSSSGVSGIIFIGGV